MRLYFMRVNLIALAAFAVIASSGLSQEIAAAQNATAAATTASTVVAPASTAAATAAQPVFPLCDPSATPAVTAAATAAATIAAPVAGTAVPTATVNPQAGYLGVGAKQVFNCGAILLDINTGYAADKAGLKFGDVVVAVNGQPITSLDQFRITVQSHKAGDVLTLAVQRAGQSMTVTVTLTAIPNSVTATQAATAASGSGAAAGTTATAAG